MDIPTFIKWPGGKRRLISQIDSYLPPKIDRYFEPFLGGGAMFFHVKQKYNPKFCMISDINEDLIETFKAVRDEPRKLLRHLKFFSENNSKEFYYRTRKEFNDKKIVGLKRCAAFIYFTKTAFNGVYRVNMKGEFNVPYGDYKNREVFNKKDIMLASKLLQGVIIQRQGYEEISSYVRRGDLVYLDPCYDPLKKTSFVHYTPERLQKDDREKLFNFMKSLRRKGARLVLSNNDLNEVEGMYSDAGFSIERVEASRCINCHADGRGRISELLILS